MSNVRPKWRERAGVIVRTMRRLSNVRVRNVATIGGNLAHGDPHMDLPPVLMALDADDCGDEAAPANACSRSRTFSLAITRPCSARDEIITELRIPPQGARRAAYLKCTTGSADDWPALGVAVSLEADGQGGSRATHRRQRRDRESDPPQTAQKTFSPAPPIEDAVLARAGDAAAEEAETVSDVRGSAAYKRELLRVYVRRAVRRAFEEGFPGEHGHDHDESGHHAPGRAQPAASRSAGESHRTRRIHA